MALLMPLNNIVLILPQCLELNVMPILVIVYILNISLEISRFGVVSNVPQTEFISIPLSQALLFWRLCAGFWWLPRYVGRCRPAKSKLSRKFFAVKQRLHIRIVNNDMWLRVVVYQLLSLITKVTQVNTLPEAHISRSGFLFLCTFPRKCGGVSWFSAMLNCDAAVNIYEINLQSTHLFLLAWWNWNW